MARRGAAGGGAWRRGCRIRNLSLGHAPGSSPAATSGAPWIPSPCGRRHGRRRSPSERFPSVDGISGCVDRGGQRRFRRWRRGRQRQRRRHGGDVRRGSIVDRPCLRVSVDEARRECRCSNPWRPPCIRPRARARTLRESSRRGRAWHGIDGRGFVPSMMPWLRGGVASGSSSVLGRSVVHSPDGWRAAADAGSACGAAAQAPVPSVRSARIVMRA